MARPRGARARAEIVIERLAGEYPGSATDLCALVHDTPYQLLVATILSAQSTDEMVNKVTPALIERFPTAADLAEADPAEVEALVHSTGFFRQKTKSLLGMAQALEERFGGEVPTALEDLVTLPGVGRKTGNVIRSVAFGLPGLPVDTHVGRLSRRLKLTTETDPVKAEHDLNALVPPEERGAFSLRLILHGRAVCDARRPRCDACLLADICPSAFKARRSLRSCAECVRGDLPAPPATARYAGARKEMARSRERFAPTSARSAAKSSAAMAESAVSS
jgi:endonuclease III